MICVSTSVKKNITFIKHKNTNHQQVYLSDTDIVGTSFTGKQKFHCDQCDYSCQTKKFLKKHVSHKHDDLNQKPIIQCDETKLTKQKRNLKLR